MPQTTTHPRFNTPTDNAIPLTDQAAAHRRLRRGQVLLPAALQRGLVHALLHHHHRHRLQDPDDRARWQAGQAADLGHGRPGALPHHHHRLLPRRHGHPAGLRRHRREVLQQYVQPSEGCIKVHRGEGEPSGVELSQQEGVTLIMGILYRHPDLVRKRGAARHRGRQ